MLPLYPALMENDGGSRMVMTMRLCIIFLSKI